MSRRISPMLSSLLAILAVILLVSPVRAAWQESYCSSQNTGNTDVYTWDYQSNGNCTNHCTQEGSFAFAVIQWKDCYCSNYIPSQQVNINQCQQGCPGFPAEHCGNIDDGLYIYIKMSGQPSGTVGGSRPTSAIVSSSPPPVSTQAPSSTQIITPPSARPSQLSSSVRRPGTATVTQTVVSVPPIVTVRPPSSASTASSTSTRPSSAPQPTEDPQTSVQVITQSGAVITRTVVQTPSSNPSASSAPARTDKDDGPNVGAIAGGVAGGVVGLLAIIGLVGFVLWRRRKQQRQAQDEGQMGSSGSSGGITRNTSTMSKAGLLGGATEVDHQYPPRIATNYSTQNSRYGTDHESISPISNRRNSQPLMIDSRLNPNAVITFAAANASRESVASLDDSRDYGRQLNVRNPDP
ncbi:hypothetical protein FB567DRAFT_256668 [Paraphoma chrysanthemicola]|uniref:WSC domain-containing protein n=1 Tax=Paraphoma chrysanthemicola TaxID=798071 RepID=A0A8K0QSI6_9PLEO|nr:hypothetical protein FB567DRAFT_256668 [Paraphoma chrysanthemicola]